MDIGASFVADGESAEAMQPGDRPFNDPSRDAETTSVRGAAAREDGDDALREQSVAMRLRVVAAIALEHAGAAAGTAAPTAHGGQGRDQRIQVGDVVDVGGGHLGDERDAARVRDEVNTAYPRFSTPARDATLDPPAPTAPRRL